SSQSLTAYELVWPIVPLERPVLLIVPQEPCGIEGVNRILREIAKIDGFDFHLERAFSPQHGLDPSEPCATEQARQAQIQPMKRVLGERRLRRGELVACAFDFSGKGN